ncbi:MAG: LamG domain-containing protein, partial [Acidobacteria bacterium]|nr:LamG domain-containing protein [Acidobacteriota bacterium]
NYFRNAWPDPSRVTLAGYSNGVESYIPNERMLWHDRLGPVSPDRFEGYMAIRSYGLARPNWSNSDLLSAPKGGSEPHSLSLNGTGAHVRVPYGTALDITDSLTLEAWVKLDTLGTQRGIVERFGAPNSGSGGYDLRVTAGGKLHFFIGYDDSTDTSKYKFIRSTNALSTGVWHHVAGVYERLTDESGEMRIYVDGALDTSASATTSVSPGRGTSHLLIGVKGNDAAGGDFSGLIDEARVTAGAVYSHDFTPATRLTAVAGTRGLWKFDGETMADSSGNGNNGTGSPSYSVTVP